jgi:hypothetical protein
MMAPAADLIVTNGPVLTMDEPAPRAEAVALAGNRIAAVGTYAEVAALRGPATRVVDAAGGSVLPGFIEGHMHLFGGAAALGELVLDRVGSLAELAELVHRHAADRPDDRVIFAGHAPYGLLDQAAALPRHALDRILPARPLALMAADAHTVWANSAALALAGLRHGRDLPPGHEVVLDEQGEATGELRETEAFWPILQLLPTGGRSMLGYATGRDPDPLPDARARATDRAVLERGLAYCASLGITSIHNMDGNFYQLALLDEIEQTSGLRCRVQIPYHHKSDKTLADIAGEAVAMRARYRSERLYSGRVKLFMDGVLESCTALLLDDYADRPGLRGEGLFSAEDFAAIATEADRLGFQISVHAIGDGAVRRTLDGYAAARAANGVRDGRHRIEHIELVDPADLPRFAALGVIASMQPLHAPGPLCFAEEPTLSRIGARRLPYAYAWRTLRAQGARLTFSSDWPVSPLAPLLSIQAAVLRKPWRPGLPEQAQTLMEALASYTRDGAHAEFAEHRKGRLRAGMLADLVVLDADLERTEPAALHQVAPRLTVCDGRITYEA